MLFFICSLFSFSPLNGIELSDVYLLENEWHVRVQISYGLEVLVAKGGLFVKVIRFHLKISHQEDHKGERVLETFRG
jgi:hypothetical protein